MAIAIAPEIGTSLIKLTSPNGSIATFNVPTDPNYVGMLSEFTGIDSPEIREEFENRPAQNGANHGTFLFGRRPITMSGKVIGVATATDRRIRLDKLQRCVLNCMRGDGTLTWTSGAQSVFVKVRVQQPLRVTGAWVKDFQISLVADDPRIFSSNLITTSIPAAINTVTIVNEGSAPTFPTGYIAGPNSPNLIFINITTGKFVQSTANSVSLTFNNEARTLMAGGTSFYFTVTLDSTWWPLEPGNNSVRLYGAGNTGSDISVTHRHAWF